MKKISILLLGICFLPALAHGEGITAPVNPEGAGAVTAPVAAIAGGPRALLEERDDAVRAIIERSDTEAAKVKKELRELINGIMDFRELARRSLGAYWGKVSAADQEQFVRLFRELIELTSTKKLEIFKADRVEYPEEKVRGKEAEVKALIYKGREKVEVIYLMRRAGPEWKIYDMIVDELGLAENYRTQFSKIIAEKRFSGLLKRLRTRIAEEKAGKGP